DGIGVTVSLADAGANTGEAAGDSFVNIQNLIGSAFDDVLIGDAMGNRLDGGDGNDRIIAGLGKDYSSGGAGADTFVFSAMAESPTGGNRDVITDFESIDTIDLTGIDANATLAGLQGFTFIGLSSGTSVGQGQLKLQQWAGITYLLGNAGTDTVADFQVELTGLHNLTTDNFIGLGRAILSGTANADTLKGTNGDDTLNGLGGADRIIGGLGKDLLTGGTGIDTFVLTALADSAVGANRDVITDFETIDKIDLSAIDANASQSGTQKWAFAGLRGADTNVLQGQIEYYHSGGNTFIIGNAGPDGVADFEIQLTGIKTITADNFIGAEKLVEHINFGGGVGDDVLTIAGNGTLTYRDATLPAGVRLAGPAAWTVQGVGNFSGDLTDDVVYKTSGGWYGLINATGGNTNIGYRNGMTLKAVGDYNGDGRDDLLFQSDTSGWLSYVRGGDLANVNVGSRAGSSLIATGDFNGDGREDLLFQSNTSGWLSYARGGDLGNVNVGFRPGQALKAVADFDGDGRDDVLFQSTSSGWISYAKAGNGANFDIGYRNGQTLLGVGDFNGDGAMDLLFRSGSGWMFYTRGDTGANVNIGTIANSTVVGIGDYDADGQSDLLLQHTNGDLSYRPGAATSGSVALGAAAGLEVIADLGTSVGDDMLIA
ncbi:MAG: VCBS repeat-containing protein, partial [Alphaproteobacteria bacterium]|nr:VCBS repeat-containing protein [Alphaproteobacteria bacterium]